MIIDQVYAAKHLATLYFIEKQLRISKALMMWAVSEPNTTRSESSGQARGQIRGRIRDQGLAQSQVRGQIQGRRNSARKTEAGMMRFIEGTATVTWSCILFLFTCTHNLEAFMFHEHAQFRWGGHIQFHDLLTVSDAHVLDPFWLFVKLGHFCGFAIIDLLLAHFLHRPRLASCLTILFAVLTELLQLGFGRDGRLYDIFIDSLGVIWIALCQSRTKERDHMPTSNG
jgi:hypothetical protein